MWRFSRYPRIHSSVRKLSLRKTLSNGVLDTSLSRVEADIEKEAQVQATALSAFHTRSEAGIKGAAFIQIATVFCESVYKITKPNCQRPRSLKTRWI